MPSLSPNQLNSASNVDDQQNEILSEKQSLTRLQNEIGSKVLSLVNFESKHKDIVESSFNKARQNKEKLPGKNNERRNFAYLSRLNNMVEKYGDKVEQKLWEASAENLVMDYEDIPDAYWKQQEQILRDNGQGRELSKYQKEILAEDLIEKQRESINTWSNYLGDKDCPYPTWFKVYAFDGVSKMGLINKETKEFEKRDKTTVASFPTLNPEVLAKVYRNINEFYAVNEEDWLAQHPDDEKLVSLVKSGNFPKLYAKELFDTKTIIKTPENPEDVEGDWFTYQLGDEDELAKTAEGTGWCIADPNVARSYLSYGNYAGNENDWEDDEDWEDDDEDDDEDWEDEEEDWKEEEDNNNWGEDENNPEEDENNPEEDNESNPKAKFIVFKLKAPNSPDGYSTNGVASIRLDPDGKVTEVSGLNEGQAIEDSLIPTVKEKVLSLPGGKEFLQKFEDKQTLIKLDHKMQNGEDLTKEELSFLYELDRPIATLDTYNSRDPRITELKEKYGIEYTLEKGVDANKLASSLEPEDIAKNLDPLIRHGVDIDINELVSDLDSVQIAKNLDKLIEHGADIDVNELVSSLYPDDIAYNLEYLLEHGASVNNLVNNMMSYDIIANLDYLLEHGADINNIENNIDSDDTSDNLDYLLEHGADINNILDNMDSDDISYNLDSLLKNGVDINNIVNRMNSDDVEKNLDYLLEHGADINNIVNHMDSDDIAYDPDYLLKHGADINNIVNHMYPEDIEKRLDYLLEHGAEIDVNKLVSDLDFLRIADNLDTLLRNGADIDDVIKRLDKRHIKDNISSENTAQISMIIK
ncbi:hypothetical protein [Candidatus Nanosyncoccus nanoralicus]|uniref:Ankyrin repeat domain-containing protein n=1 Tax=Candidatus Nanosyncoccus nanoralicus TaxID=2171996 RepID=A0ABY0FJE9_9BACT|nr:hypothetical protein [Candidatus Nanosyncoccus nanoralicus]RYC73125.1 hypothetical protein G3KMM_00537 [Candidatus Nanosyncoccus nanoralicus]